MASATVELDMFSKKRNDKNSKTTKKNGSDESSRNNHNNKNAKLNDYNVDSLLEFIEQKAKTKIKGSGNNGNKAAKNGSKKENTAAQQQKKVRETAATTETVTSSPEEMTPPAKPVDVSLPTPPPPPPPQPQAVKPAEMVLPLSHHEFVDYEDELSAFAKKNDSSDEFVMVKGRKHAKTNKKSAAETTSSAATTTTSATTGTANNTFSKQFVPSSKAKLVVNSSYKPVASTAPFIANKQKAQATPFVKTAATVVPVAEGHSQEVKSMPSLAPKIG